MKPADSFIEQPVRSLQTMLRLISKDDPRQPTVVPDGIYGPTTMHAVSAFQRRYGLPATGITDRATWERITAVYDVAQIRADAAEPIRIVFNSGQVFRLGDSNPYLYLLQAMLMQLSVNHSAISPPEVTGVLDEQTAAALSAFQRLAGLEETGELDKVTWKHLALQFTLDANRSAEGRLTRRSS